MTKKSQWITVSEASELSGYNEEHIRRLLRSGEVVGKKFGIVWQVNHASILKYLSLAEGSEDKRQGPKKTTS